MKRIAFVCIIGGALLASSGCEEVKRKATEAARGEGEKAIDRGIEATRKKAADGADAAVDKASGEDNSPEAKKRDKLKGHGDDDQ